MIIRYGEHRRPAGANVGVSRSHWRDASATSDPLACARGSDRSSASAAAARSRTVAPASPVARASRRWFSRSGTCRRVLWPLLIALGLCGGASHADSLVPRGRPVPDLALPALSGETVELADLKGRIVVLLFGELYNSNSLAAGRDIAAVLAEPGMADINASAYLVITQKGAAADLAADADKKGVTLPILHDPDRRSFASYHVMVLPSLVVIDAAGASVLSCAGYPLDFRDLVSDALSHAAGKLSEEAFNRRRATATQPAVPESQVRAKRLAALAKQLARRGSEQLAIDRFAEAIALYADCIPARIGLGKCLLNQRDLAKAEVQFQHVLRVEPESVEASLGLSQIQALRGGDELLSAEKRLRGLLSKRPDDPRVLYGAAVVAEKSGDMDTALTYYKRAAAILLHGERRRWTVE